MNGQQVFRATDVCFEGPVADTGDRTFWETRLNQWLTQRSSGLALLTQVAGDVVALGSARFAIDEQWWLFDPALGFGESVFVDNFNGTMEFSWGGLSSSVSEGCRQEMLDSARSAADGRLLRVVEFVLDTDDIIRLNRASQPAPAAFACAHLDCADSLDPAETCVDHCTNWRLPLAISFERVEPFDRAAMCAPSVWNPAER